MRRSPISHFLLSTASMSYHDCAHRTDQFKRLYRLHTCYASPTRRHRAQGLSRPWMRKFPHLRVVAFHRGDLCLQSLGNVDENIGTERRLHPLESPFRRRRNFERVNLAHALPRHRPGRGQHGAMHHSMIYIQVSGMMRVDNFRPKPRYQLFHKFHHLEQWHGIEAVVGKLAESLVPGRRLCWPAC